MEDFHDNTVLPGAQSLRTMIYGFFYAFLIYLLWQILGSEVNTSKERERFRNTHEKLKWIESVCTNVGSPSQLDASLRFCQHLQSRVIVLYKLQDYTNGPGPLDPILKYHIVSFIDMTRSLDDDILQAHVKHQDTIYQVHAFVQKFCNDFNHLLDNAHQHPSSQNTVTELDQVKTDLSNNATALSKTITRSIRHLETELQPSLRHSHNPSHIHPLLRHYLSSGSPVFLFPVGIPSLDALHEHLTSDMDYMITTHQELVRHIDDMYFDLDAVDEILAEFVYEIDRVRVANLTSTARKLTDCVERLKFVVGDGSAL